MPSPRACVRKLRRLNSLGSESLRDSSTSAADDVDVDTLDDDIFENVEDVTPKTPRASQKYLSLADFPLSELGDAKALFKSKTAFPLKRLQLIAKTENFDPDWQHISARSAEHRRLLCDAIATAKVEQHNFLVSIREHGQTAVERGITELEEEAGARWPSWGAKLRQNKKKTAKQTSLRKFDDNKEEATRGTLPDRFAKEMERAVAACIHIVPSGSGVVIDADRGLILTCAHCIDAYGDEEEGQEGDREIFRIGRFKVVVWADGGYRVAQCVACDETNDCALLKIVSHDPKEISQNSKKSKSKKRKREEEEEPELTLKQRPWQSLPLWSSSKVTEGVPAVCIGNPYDWDLETQSQRRTGYLPFYTSCGRVDAVDTDEGSERAQRSRRLGLGLLRHSCWTYWGHSGAPIISLRDLCTAREKVNDDNDNSNGEGKAKATASDDGGGRGGSAVVVGMHNSWDSTRKAQRHGVPGSRIAKLVHDYYYAI